MRNWNVTSPKDETQAGLFCECSGNIELHLLSDGDSPVAYRRQWRVKTLKNVCIGREVR
jgi:hypothetical protein